ncbi:hypothetical protein [Nocardiopsis tropica]|uniref:Helix-turn-helix domain-containing protein n=1 Tax=Nocardiopsis tropica TaxID=109330 RepID=A0ABU7KQX0_9ACTN|nr:hypothetical protein [Nocardiopsis umidischolae]MEE2051688.1 hypothetical protein [Nocardiopsis umidischolae]
MPRGQRISDEQRASILEDIRAGGSCRGIAKDHGVSPGSVTNIAKKAGLSDAFERADTEKATRARTTDMAALRAEISEKYLRKASELLDQMDQPHLVFSFGGKENTYNEAVLERAPTGDLRNLMTASAVALDKHLKILATETDPGAATAASMLSGIADALEKAAEVLDSEPSGEG